MRMSNDSHERNNNNSESITSDASFFTAARRAAHDASAAFETLRASVLSSKVLEYPGDGLHG